MRKYLYLGFDLGCIGTALILALFLRNGFPLIEEGNPDDIYGVMAVTLGVALILLPLMRTHTSLWRYTSFADISGVILTVTLIVLLSNISLFLINRLEVMPRSVPPMHWALAILAMVGGRLLARRLFGPSLKKTENENATKQHVLVVGVGHVAELYLQFVRRILHDQVVVEGFLDEDAALTGRTFQKVEILGTPAELPQVLERLHVHGIRISQVVVAQNLESLSQQSQAALRQLEEQTGVELVQFDRQIGPQSATGAEVERLTLRTHQPQVTQGADAYEEVEGMYPYVKRAIDVVGSLSLMILFSPLIGLTAILVALDVGLPLFFWQQRPGRYGKPFRLYKYRTMRPATRKWDEDRLEHKARDGDRTSVIGKWIRRLHLDELPQLYHIFRGRMSFVGPRPLLPDDQPENGAVRLSVRPGVTGWAQVHGGDFLTPEEKLVLDHWYIQNMSLWLDIQIVLKTLVVAVRGDKPELEVVEQSRKMLRQLHPVDDAPVRMQVRAN